MTYALHRSKDYGVIILRADTLMVLLEFNNCLLLKPCAHFYLVTLVSCEKISVAYVVDHLKAM
jgi:hypothetical protein